MRLLALFILLAALGQLAESEVANRCSACQAIVSEVADAVKEDKKSLDLDIRSRLDSTGKRKGKVIEWQTSELRAMEILENVCSNMKDYAVVTKGKGRKLYQKVNNVKSVSISGSISFGGGGANQEDTKKLKLFCESVLEDFEEDLQRLIGENVVDKGIWKRDICLEATHYCRKGRKKPQKEPEAPTSEL